MLHDLEIGKTVPEGELVFLNAAARARNMLIVGPPGSGKTKFIEDQIRQLIIEGEGLCVIDPDGTLCEAIVESCAENRWQRHRRIHLFDPHQEGWGVGFDPLRVRVGAAERPSPEMIDAMRVARSDFFAGEVAQVFEGNSLNTYQTPLLRKCLRATIYALSVNELTLGEVTSLTTSTDFGGVRKALTASLPNQEFRAIWAEFNALSRREFTEQFGSTMNRMVEFVSSPLIRRLLAQRERVLDTRAAMDRGEIILVNLAPSDRFSLENGRLLGTLIVGDLVMSALGRSEDLGRRRPFNLIIDEAPRFLNSDIELLLDRLRKRGLHLTLAMQRLGQAREAGPGVYNALMIGAQTKVIFRSAEEDGEVLAKELFRPEFDLNQVKLESPAVVGHHIEELTGVSVADGAGGALVKTASENYADIVSTTEIESQSESASDSWGQGTNSSEGGLNEPWLLGTQPASPLTTWNAGGSQFQTGSRALANGRAQSASRGRARGGGIGIARGTQWNRVEQHNQHQVFAPDIEWIPTQLKGPEEVVHDHIVKLRQLPDRHAVVKVMHLPTLLIRTLDVKPTAVSPQRVAAFVEEVLSRSAYTSPAAAIALEIAERQERLAKLAEEYATPPPLKDDGWARTE